MVVGYIMTLESLRFAEYDDLITSDKAEAKENANRLNEDSRKLRKDVNIDIACDSWILNTVLENRM